MFLPSILHLSSGAHDSLPVLWCVFYSSEQLWAYSGNVTPGIGGCPQRYVGTSLRFPSGVVHFRMEFLRNCGPRMYHDMAKQLCEPTPSIHNSERSVAKYKRRSQVMKQMSPLTIKLLANPKPFSNKLKSSCLAGQCVSKSIRILQ